MSVHPHWLFALRAIVRWVLCVAAAIAGLVLVPARYNWFVWVALALFVVPGISVAWAFVRRYRTELRINVDGVHILNGVIRRNYQVIPLPRIDDVSVKQSVIQRLCRLGDLEIVSGSGSSKEVFGWTPEPHQVAASISEWISLRYNTGPTQALRN